MTRAELWALGALARPRMLPLVLLLPGMGYAWAHWDRRLPLTGAGAFAAVLLAWTALHAGTLWLNAALDQDQDAVLFGRPQPVPAAAGTAGYLALALCLGAAAFAGPLAFAAAAACALLAVLYSHPRTRWKAHALGGPAVNAIGYGLLSPLAGWAAVGGPGSPRSLLVWPLLAIGLLAPTFLSQAFQGQADRARGYRTLVVSHGPRACLIAARLSLALALGWGLALAAVDLVPRLCLLGAGPWILVDRWLARWQEKADQADASVAQGLVLRMLAATAATVGLAAVDLVWPGPP